MAKSTRKVTFYRWEAMPREVVSPTLERRLITGDFGAGVGQTSNSLNFIASGWTQ